MNRIYVLFILIFASMNHLLNQSLQTLNQMNDYPNEIYEIGKQWADSTYNTLSEDEQIAQLFWIAIENPDNKTLYEKNKKLIENHKPGGIILFRMTSQKAKEIIDEFQNISKTPLIVSIDGENGVAMRITDATEFPKAMTLGAITDDKLIYELGTEIARQCNLLGIHANMAPVADINSNPKNPVIGTRSYGENPQNVSNKTIAYMHGLQAGGVMAIAKHFPGHGDTDTDSHKTLPKINHDRQRLDSIELVPFKLLINDGIWGIMTAHIEAPALEETKIPASFSENILKNILRNELNFNGLIFTDAINMQGAKTMGSPGEIDALALAAGNDIILFTENLPEAIKQVKEMIIADKISKQQIEQKCKRALSFKYHLLQQNKLASQTENLTEQLNSFNAKDLNRRLNEAAVTLLINNNNIIPLKDSAKWGAIIVGSAPEFEKAIKEYPQIKLFKITSEDDIKYVGNFENLLIIIADDKWAKNAANSAKKQQLLELAKNKNSVILFMGNVYNLSDWQVNQTFDAAIVTYQKTKESQEAIVKAFFGKTNISGRLPVSIGNLFKEGSGEMLIY